VRTFLVSRVAREKMVVDCAERARFGYSDLGIGRNLRTKAGGGGCQALGLSGPGGRDLYYSQYALFFESGENFFDFPEIMSKTFTPRLDKGKGDGGCWGTKAPRIECRKAPLNRSGGRAVRITGVVCAACSNRR
jgi:hypothetical protein